MTNDGATILKLLEVEHPAAKVLVELADLQDQEVGDGTTSVVRYVLSAAFLYNFFSLIEKRAKKGIHINGLLPHFCLAGWCSLEVSGSY